MSADDIIHKTPTDIIVTAGEVCTDLGIASSVANCTPIIKALKNEREGVDWRKIETAPENRAILIHIPHLDYYGNNGVYAGMLVNMGTGIRWMTFGHAIGRDLGRDDLPDAWCEFPAAPKAEG